MIVYRLCKKIYKDDLSGRGAERSGGRWNSKGIAMLYTSSSRALCTTEIAVHSPLGIVPEDYFLITIEIPDEHPATSIETDDLPEEWKSFPPVYATQEIGDRFSREEKFLVMKVPSAIVQGDYNYIINPYHKDFHKVSIKNTEPFGFNERLFVR